jgi:hypothetical protein
MREGFQALAALTALAAAPAAAAQPSALANDYPTEARAEYVFAAWR